MSSNQLDKKSQAWSALFSEPMSELVKRYTASVDFDKRLWKADIEGSLAHAEMLAAQGVIAASDLADIQRGMAQIKGEIEAGSFEWKLDLEDVHLNIEARHYFRQARWFFGLGIALLVVSVLKDVALDGELPDLPNLLAHLLFAALWGTAAVTRGGDPPPSDSG